MFKHGRLIDFMLSDRRNAHSAHRFLSKALTTIRHWQPSSITTDQLGSYPQSDRPTAVRRHGVGLRKATHLQVFQQLH
jgi:transposase-like protein